MSVGNDGKEWQTGNQTGSKEDSGIKISQIGYNAKTAPDYGLIFNSSWRSQQIVAFYSHVMTTGDIPSNGYIIPITFTHGLGHVYHAESFILSGSDKSIIAPFPIFIAKNSVTFDANSSNFTIEKTETVKVGDTLIVLVYNIDIEKSSSYSFDFGEAGSASFYDRNVGIKAPSPSKSIDSSDLKDFLVHSRASTPMTMYVGTNNEILNPSPLNTSVSYYGGYNPVSGGPLMWNAPDNSIYRYYAYELLPAEYQGINDEITYAPCVPLNNQYGSQALPSGGYISSTYGEVKVAPLWNKNSGGYKSRTPPNGYSITNSVIVMRAPIDNNTLKRITV